MNMAQDMSCKMFTKTFTNEGSIFKHMKLDHEDKKMYNCEQCRKLFGNRGTLKTHVLIHTGEKLHKCTQCNYSANQAVSLRKHILTHTGATIVHNATSPSVELEI